MKFIELVKFSFLNLWRRKLRTTLTVLGVMIGTASIVVMMSLGIGLNKSYMDQIANSATLTLITVYNYGGGMYYDGGKGMSGGEQLQLTADVVDSFSAMEHVKTASPVYNFGVYAKSGKYESYIDVNAMSYDMLLALKLPIMQGAMPERGAPFTILAGRMTGFNFYDPNSQTYVDYWSDPEAKPPVDLYETPVFVVYDTNAYWNWQSGMGDAPKKYMLETAAVIGEPNSEYGFSQFDYSTYADIEAVETLFSRIFKQGTPWPNQPTDSKGKPLLPISYNMAYVLVDDIDHVAAVQEQIVSMGFQASSEIDYLRSMQEQSRTIQYVLGGIGSVALLVAAIGITNTMLMSIFERTKEIGIFKVLGCSLPNIRTMFLTEAALIGVTGGVVGLGLSFGLSAVINLLLNNISFIPAWLALAGLLIALVVGMVAGIAPALRAMKLSPLEAIRTL